jgi:endoglucanase
MDSFMPEGELISLDGLNMKPNFKTINVILKLFFFAFTILTISCSGNNDGIVEMIEPIDAENSNPDENEQEPEQNGNTNLNTEQATSGEIRSITSMELVAEMGIGWNLGNSMDVEAEDKTLWGNPLPTKSMIVEVANRGFSTLRLPVTWDYHLEAEAPFSVDPNFLDRIQEIVDYALEAGMHVILNTHHEDTWIVPTNTAEPMVKVRLSALWTQISERFITYGDYLIFETLNEPRYEGSPEEWTGGTAEGRAVVNEYHRVSLNAIRATGGNNLNRHIMISPYAASSYDFAMNELQIPNNDDKVIISIHSYFPFDFTLNQTGTANWGSNEEINALIDELERIRNKWIITEKRPVILGEWGVTFKNNNQVRENYVRSYVSESLSRGLLPIVWDNGLENELGLFDRRNNRWNWHSNVVNAILEASN